MQGELQHDGPPRARRTRSLAVALAASFAAAATASIGVAPATGATTTWTDGACATADPGVTVVVDFQQLDGNEGKRAETVVRCVPARGATRSGIEVLRAAGLRVTGVRGADADSGAAFVCRIQSRPAPDETLRVSADATHVESCGATPPTTAYWSYWHAPRLGAPWVYSTLGAAARTPSPGSVEGWSFALGSTGGTPRAPERVTAADVAPEPTPAPEPAPIPAPVDPPAPTPTPDTPAAGSDPLPAPAPTPVPAPASPTDPIGGEPSDTTAPIDPTAGTEATDPSAAAAVDWLASELAEDDLLPGPSGDDADIGLSIDALFAMRAVARDEHAARIASALERATPELVEGSDPGLVAKLHVAFQVAGRDTTDISGVDLHAATLELATDADASLNTFGRSFVVLGLARAGDLPATALDDLRAAQCPGGWFVLDVSSGCAADAADTDATAMAIQALAGEYIASSDPATLAAIRRAAGWLGALQRPDGSFGGGPTTRDANANSTGLAAQALDAAASVLSGVPATRAREARERTTGWMPALVADSAIDGDVTGAVAYDVAALTAARTDGVDDAQRDQWRRATAQGAFAFAPVSLHRLGGTPLPELADTTAASERAKSSSGGAPERLDRRTALIAAVAVVVGALLAIAVLLFRRSTGGDA